MTEHESLKFIEELTICFPGFAEVAQRYSPDYERTKKAWCVTWADLSLNECREVMRQLMLKGGIAYDEYREPGPFIRRLALQNRKNAPKSDAELAGREKTRREIETQRRAYQGSPMAYALLEMRRLKTLGVPEHEILGAGELILEGRYVQRHFSSRAS